MSPPLLGTQQALLASMSRTFLMMASFLELSCLYTSPRSEALTTLMRGTILCSAQKSIHSWVWGSPPIREPAMLRFLGREQGAGEGGK